MSITHFLPLNPNKFSGLCIYEGHHLVVGDLNIQCVLK